MKPQPAIFEEHEIRRVYDEATEIWWFSVVDIVQVLTQQPDYQAARNYWKVLKNRLSKEGGADQIPRLPHRKHGRKAAAGRAEVGRLALIQAGAD